MSRRPMLASARLVDARLADTGLIMFYSKFLQGGRRWMKGDGPDLVDGSAIEGPFGGRSGGWWSICFSIQCGLAICHSPSVCLHP